MSLKKYLKTMKDDEDNLDIVSPCFKISPDVQLKEVPTNGEEYLLKVIKERKNIAAVTKCNKDYSKFAENQSQYVHEFPRLSVPEKLKPTIEWQNMQVADFSETRMYISRLLSKRKIWKNNINIIEIKPTCVIEWKQFFSTHIPTLSCVLGLQHALLDQGQWVYAFLACTQLPLLSDTTSILRNLARKCAEIRFRLNPDEENAITAATPLNIFICLVARYFRQYDLAD
ncbi:gem-associated protein 2 isoform X2 [Bombyx mori]|uniref:gem-associated protein 2 isoform X2 n=1 Tax=Bombyx mori TaxID=7091 RepID=UPI002ED2083D